MFSHSLKKFVSIGIINLHGHSLLHSSSMANSKYEYVRQYEDATDNKLLKGCFIVVRIDGQSFHQVSKKYNFTKPNDKRCLDLMVTAGETIMNQYFPEIVVSYGQSDEFSFVFRKSSKVHNRRMTKFTSLITSLFTSSFIRNWNRFFPSTQLTSDISFDGRCVLYPDLPTVLDYLNWRQVDCHINNLYNTTFHALTGEYKRVVLSEEDTSYTETELPVYEEVKKLTATEAHDKLKGSISSDKNEILFSTYKVNYNNELAQFKKGTLICIKEDSVPFVDKLKSGRVKQEFKSTQHQIQFDVLNVDIINGKFWSERPYITKLLNE